MKGPLLLLAAPSRESRDKAAHFAAAARALDVPAHIHTIQMTQTKEQIMTAAGQEQSGYVLACSDALAETAATLNEIRGHATMSAALTASLVDKASGIPLLSRLLDLPVLPQIVPEKPGDLRAWPYGGAVIAKPTCSAGGWSPRPWGYRRFESADAFLDWLECKNLTANFFAEQQRPGPLGPVMLQAAIDNDQVEVASLLLGPEGATVFCRGYGQFEVHDAAGHGRRWVRALYHAGAAPALGERLPRLADLLGRMPGWGYGLLHVQGIRSESGFFLTDINLRLSTAWDWLIAVVDPSFHRRVLASFLFGAAFAPLWPAPAMAIDLVYGPPNRGIAQIQYPSSDESILPWRMRAQDCSQSEQDFDKAGQMPSFISLGRDVQDCARRADAFRAGLDIAYLPEPRA